VPRAKYIKPPGPFLSIEKIQRSKFQFRSDQWRKLTELLPSKLADLGVPPDTAIELPEKVKTIADWVILETENAIKSHQTTTRLDSGARMKPANVRAAIRRLREALKPFVQGWVDSETADIVPVDLDARLAARDEEIAELRLPPARQRSLAMLCRWIENCVRQFASANGETVSEQEMLRYVDASLNFAGINHPNISKHRDRLAALVFPKDAPPHLQG
jgi:hypothetical protein